jgi:hypothetical protein
MPSLHCRTDIKNPKRPRLTLTAHTDAVLVVHEGAAGTIWTGSLNGKVLPFSDKSIAAREYELIAFPPSFGVKANMRVV